MMTRQSGTALANRNHPLLRGALHLWHLHPTSGYRDLIGSAHAKVTGAVPGAIVNEVGLKYANSTDVADCGAPPDVDSLSSSTGYTFGCRVYLSSVAARGILIGKDDNTLGREFHLVVSNSGAGDLDFVVSTTSQVTASGVVPAGQWCNIVHTRGEGTAGTAKLYVNAVLVATSTVAGGNIAAQLAHLTLGARTLPGSTNPISGLMNQAWIINRAWRAADVAQQHANPWYWASAPARRVWVPQAAANAAIFRRTLSNRAGSRSV